MKKSKNQSFRFFAIIGIFLLWSSIPFKSCIAQTQLNVNLSQKDRTDSKIIRSTFPNEHQPDSITAIRQMHGMLADLFDAGFLAASIDSISGNKNELSAYLNPGVQYKWSLLQNGNIDEGLLSEAGFREKIYNNQPLKLNQLNKLNRRILEYCENHGYPFASLTYRNFKFEENKITAALYIDLDKKIVIDTIIVRGNAKLSRIYLYNYLSIKPGDTYNESLIRKIPNRLKELPMITEIKPFSVAFTSNTAQLILNLNDKKSSQIDGVIGVLPDNVTGKVQVSGDIRIRLLSSFGRGELFDLNWKQPQVKTQDLKVKLNYPFIFSSPFGLDLNLGIYKKDTSYLEVNLGAGVQFLLKGGDYFKVFVNKEKSSLLSTKAFENATVLPAFADIQTTSYGVGFKSEKLDYRLNPRKGYSFEITTAVGNKIISKNNKLPVALYDSLDLKTVVYSGDGNLDIYFPILARGVFNFGVKGASMIGDNIFTNELSRFGGLRTLRGFDEESILASSYAIGKAELRYILEQNSYLFVFYNSAWYERSTRFEYINDTPLGFGAGITFETKLGIFSFNYALGKEFDNPIRFKAAKIHFGLINYF